VTDWIGAAEAAQRLGIKQASLYSYVSRGVLTRRRSAADRVSLFDAREVERLARRGRPRRVHAKSELVIETSLTEISGGQLRYRGHDVMALAAEQSFEAVAGLLWTGSLDEPASMAWQATPEAVAAGTAAQAALPTGTLPLERLQVIVPAMAATDPLRLHLDPSAVQEAARCLIAGMVECLPIGGAAGTDTATPAPAAPARTEVASAVPAGRTLTGRAPTAADPAPMAPAAPASAGGITERLAPRLSIGPLAPGLTNALRAALVLLADHELAASTLAARVAASVRADPYAVVATGLGALGGSLHEWWATCSGVVSESPASVTSSTRPATREPFC
jgi:citrate synthase